MTDTATTTAVRNHSMDLYRVVALLLVVLGHWMAASLTFSDGAFWRDNPLVDLPWTQWLTWIFQVVPVFFVVAGYASAVSWTQRSADESRQAWLRRRLVRPIGPTAVYVVFALLVVAVLFGVGVAGSELDFGAWAVAMHLWFLGIYVLVVALTPVAVALHRRWGKWVPFAMTVAVAVLDVATIGAHLPYVGWLNYLLVWGVLYQLGIAFHDGTLCRRAAIAAGGLFGGRVGAADYGGALPGQHDRRSRRDGGQHRAAQFGAACARRGRGRAGVGRRPCRQ